MLSKLQDTREMIVYKMRHELGRGRNMFGMIVQGENRSLVTDEKTITISFHAS